MQKCLYKYVPTILHFFPGLLGTASFVILDTDYNNYAFLCTCQSKSVLGFLTFHRRSCTILQRSPERDSEIVRQVNYM